MPLVSGVCRAASAPKLSHGGSRLNASKPEANPKTSCPNHKRNISTKKIKNLGGLLSTLHFFFLLFLSVVLFFLAKKTIPKTISAFFKKNLF
jgi:hypothetical protein